MGKRWRLWKLQMIHSYMRFMLEAQKYQELGMFIKNAKDLSIIYDGIQFLYDENQWDILDDIFYSSTSSSSIIQPYLIDLYQKECTRLEEERGLSEFYVKYRSKEYSKELDTMLSHIFSIKGDIPNFGEILTKLFIEGASISTLINRITLILDHYPEKRAALSNALLTRNNLLQMKNCQTSDLSLISYVFHCIEPMYEQMKEGTPCTSNISQEQIIALYDKCKQLVMDYNQGMVKEFQNRVQMGISMNEEEIQKELLQSEKPILSMIDVLPISEEEKEDIILKVMCDGAMKNELMTAFQNRHQNPQKVKLLDFYYVLYQNPIQQQLGMSTQQLRNQNICCRNQQYLETMKQKKHFGHLSEEDIIGAICSLKAYPIFGLFSLISNLPLEELKSIASNLTFETLDMQKQLYDYLQYCKQVENPYNEEFQALDVQYMKEKMAYEKMLERENKTKKKEYP